MATGTEMTIAGLKTAMATYVAKASQAGTWSKTNNNFIGLVDKVGKIITLSGGVNDKLPQLDADNNLGYAKTVEEYFISMVLPQDYSGIDNAVENTPYLPPVGDVVYNYTLGRKKVETFVPNDNIERAMRSAEDTANAVASIYEKFQASIDLTKYAIKKQLIGNAIKKAVDAGLKVETGLNSDPTNWTDTDCENFIKQIKCDVETASFAHQGGLNNKLIGAAPSLTLYVLKSVMPSITVEAIAGCFQKDALAMPAKVVVLDDFGSLTESGKTYDKCFALLVDDRAIKLYQSYQNTVSKQLAEADGYKTVYHFECTGFISKYAEIKAYLHQ